MIAASADLDAAGPFVGVKADRDQEREFPRRGQETVPDAVLDWVSLRALELSRDDEAPVSSESAGRAGQTFARPKLSRTERLMRSLLKPYLNTAPARIV